MIPNEASCPIFSFNFRRKSVVELRISGRKERKKKKKTRAYIFSFPSFFFSSHNFLCSSFVFRFYAATPIMIFDQFGKLQNTRVWFCKKKKKRRVRLGPYVRVHGRPNANVCTFHTFPKSSQEKDVCDFCTCYALEKREKNGKERCKMMIIRDMTKRDGNVRRKLWSSINQLTLLIVNVFQKGSDVFWTSRSRWEQHFLSPTYGVLQPLRILWCIRHKQFLTMLAYFIWMCFWFLYRNGSRSRSYIHPRPFFLSHYLYLYFPTSISNFRIFLFVPSLQKYFSYVAFCCYVDN